MHRLFSTFFLLIFAAQTTVACSSFFFNSEIKLLAKNFDWYSGDGYIIKNLRDQKKVSYGFRGRNVASWTSKYGSITFNQMGKEFPYGGINEKGLVIEQLWFEKSEYQNNDNKEISELEWIQFQLDNYTTVDEVIKSINQLTIKPMATIHYLLADKNGTSAVIEFVEGKVFIDRQNLKHQVITNESSADSKNYFSLNKSINLDSRTHFDRYCILQNNLNDVSLTSLDAFKKLDLVKEDRGMYKTFWSIVYNIDNMEIYYQSYENQNIKKISLSKLDFNSKTEYSLINAEESKFHEYSDNVNLQLLSNSMKMMDKKIDLSLANKHQMSPDSIVVDKVFSKNYTDLIVEFVTKKQMGNIYYSFFNGAENLSSYKAFQSGIIPANRKLTRKIFYNFPKGEFALACFLDLNNDSKMERTFLGIPTKNGFSNNKRKLFGIPPDYETAKIILTESITLRIEIK